MIIFDSGIKNIKPIRFVSGIINEHNLTIDLFVNLLSPISNKVNCGQFSCKIEDSWENISSSIWFPCTLWREFSLYVTELILYYRKLTRFEQLAIIW